MNKCHPSSFKSLWTGDVATGDVMSPKMGPRTVSPGDKTQGAQSAQPVAPRGAYGNFSTWSYPCKAFSGISSLAICFG